jgi:hypothetical protein
MVSRIKEKSIAAAVFDSESELSPQEKKSRGIANKKIEFFISP